MGNKQAYNVQAMHRNSRKQTEIITITVGKMLKGRGVIWSVFVHCGALSSVNFGISHGRIQDFWKGDSYVKRSRSSLSGLKQVRVQSLGIDTIKYHT